MLYKGPGHSSLLHNIQEEPCDFRLREQATRVCVLRSWSDISEGKAVLCGGGCRQLLSEQVTCSLSNSSAVHHLQGTTVPEVLRAIREEIAVPPTKGCLDVGLIKEQLGC